MDVVLQVVGFGTLMIGGGALFCWGLGELRAVAWEILGEPPRSKQHASGASDEWRVVSGESRPAGTDH